MWRSVRRKVPYFDIEWPDYLPQNGGRWRITEKKLPMSLAESFAFSIWREMSTVKTSGKCVRIIYVSWLR